MGDPLDPRPAAGLAPAVTGRMTANRLARMWVPQVGGFVWTPDEYEIGKLVELRDGVAVVEMRLSVVRAERREYEPTALRHAYLPLQSRVYHERNGAWFLGRVINRYVDGDSPASYLVKFPGYRPFEMGEQDLSVRCLLPLQEPVEVLASWALEVQFLADHRQVALSVLADARRVSRSLGGLLSATVELLPHQVEVVRRITEDPIQRYLLADEVGMGKTIEACAVLRQALLDNPGLRAIVAVPAPLLPQWRSELSARFGISEADERISLMTHTDFEARSSEPCDFLVVDEAHHLIRSGPDGLSDGFRRLAAAAHAAPKLLLLSATPVLSDENATLALLHLLDPHVFRLDDREGLRERLRLRQEFGKVLLGLDAKAPGFLIQEAMDGLLELAPTDATARALAGDVEGALATQEADDVPAAVRALRDHIAETYRLNQRLLRTRRRDVEGWEIPRRSADLHCWEDPDDRIRDAQELLDDWRDQANSAVAAAKREDPAAAPLVERSRARRYSVLVDGLSRGVHAFAMSLAEPSGTDSRIEAAFDSMAALRERAAVIANRGVGDPRLSNTGMVLDQALEFLEGIYGPRARLVAFSSNSELVGSLPADIARRRGFGVAFTVSRGMSPSEMAESIRKFAGAARPSVLICDQAGEEGLNLQFVQGIVHVDLPLDPLRMEQRIGRLDRIGRSDGLIHHWVRLPTVADSGPWRQWLDLLETAVALFERTIADSQFILDDVMDEVRLELLHGNLRSADVHESISRRFADERRRVDEQFALDQLEMGESDAHVLFERLTEAESTDRKFAKAMSGWWERVLRLEHFTPDESDGDTFVLRWQDSTLAPREPWYQEIEESLDTPLTYERTVALANEGVRLIRSGNPLVEVLPRFLRYDDRGTAFATWRADPKLPEEYGQEWIGFRLTYVVELDADAIAAGLEDTQGISLSGVRRRADLIFGPWVETVYVDASLDPVTEPKLLKILKRPYDRTESASSARDFNLADNRRVLTDVLDERRFVELCMAIKRARHELIDTRPEYRDRLAEARARAHSELDVRAERLERRAAAQRSEFGDVDMTATTEARISRAISAALETPLARLDSVGLLIVSKSRPSGVN